MSGAATGVMSRLRDETRDLHDDAERHTLMRLLMKGELPRDDYARHLGQLLLVHSALEAELQKAASQLPAIASVVDEYQMQVPYLREDLSFLGAADADPDALPATSRTIQKIQALAASDPLGLLGMHYVLEGSNNGGKFIAKAVSRAYSIQSGPGLRYLDPYGDDQARLWGEFKNSMEACEFSSAQQDSLVAGAREMFDAIARIADDLIGVESA